MHYDAALHEIGLVAGERVVVVSGRVPGEGEMVLFFGHVEGVLIVIAVEVYAVFHVVPGVDVRLGLERRRDERLRSSFGDGQCGLLVLHVICPELDSPEVTISDLSGTSFLWKDFFVLIIVSFDPDF